MALTGCLPDSLTKWKEKPAQKAATDDLFDPGSFQGSIGNNSSVTINGIASATVIELTSTANFPTFSYVSDGDGNTGFVLQVLPNNKLFIMPLSGFLDGSSGLDNSSTFVTSESSILSGSNGNMLLYLTDTTSFLEGDVVTTSNGGVGLVTNVDSNDNSIVVVYQSGTFRTGINNISATDAFDSSQAVSISNIVSQSVNAQLGTGQALNFSVGDTVSSTTNSGYVSAIDTVTDIISIDVFGAPFNTGSLVLDNNAPFFSAVAAISTLEYDHVLTAYRSLARNSNFLTTDSSGTFSLSISPSPPSGLTFTTTNGNLSGTPQVSSTRASYTISGSGPSGSISHTFDLKSEASFPATPKLLSSSSWNILTVNDSSRFTQYAPIVSNNDARGFVIENLNATQILVKTLSGAFSSGDRLDIKDNIFKNEIALVQSVAPTSFKLTVASTAGFTPGGFITSDNGGQGIVTLVNGTDLYVQYASGSFATAAPGNSVSPTETYSAGTATLASQMAASHFVLDVVSAANFSKGDALTTTGNLSAGEVTNIDLGANQVYMQLFEGNVVNGTGLDANNPFSVAETTVSRVSYDNFYKGLVNSEITINFGAINSAGLTYTITPSLPDGITLDSTSGVLSGIPTEGTTRTTYTITGTNSVGIVNHNFDLKIDAAFYITNSVPDTPTSYLLHRTGKGFTSHGCVITEDQVNNTTVGSDGSTLENKDITCILDGGEEDIYRTGIQLIANSSPGMCDFMTYQPYSFNKHEPQTTTTATTIYRLQVSGIGCTASQSTEGLYTTFPCFSAGVPAGCVDQTEASKYSSDSDLLCSGYDHTNATPFTTGAPSPQGSDYRYLSGGVLVGDNCDSGNIRVIDVEFSDDGLGGCNTGSKPAIIEGCQGSEYNCKYGSIRDTITQDSYESGARGVIYTANVDGIFVDNLTFSPPSNIGAKGNGRNILFTNKYLANFTLDNQCANADGYNYYSNNWYTYTQGPHTDPGAFQDINPFYTFECLDSSRDVIARIRIMVRDWDVDYTNTNAIVLNYPTNTEFKTNSAFSNLDMIDPGLAMDNDVGLLITSDTPTANVPNVGIDLFGQFYNKRSDWDNDATTDFTAGFSCAAPGAAPYNPAVEFVFPGYGL